MLHLKQRIIVGPMEAYHDEGLAVANHGSERITVYVH